LATISVAICFVYRPTAVAGLYALLLFSIERLLTFLSTEPADQSMHHCFSLPHQVHGYVSCHSAHDATRDCMTTKHCNQMKVQVIWTALTQQSDGDLNIKGLQCLDKTLLDGAHTASSGYLPSARYNLFTRWRNNPEVPPSAAGESSRPGAERLAESRTGSVPSVERHGDKVCFGHLLDGRIGEDLCSGILASLFQATRRQQLIRSMIWTVRGRAPSTNPRLTD
jgi:hypothetical protein